MVPHQDGNGIAVKGAASQILIDLDERLGETKSSNTTFDLCEGPSTEGGQSSIPYLASQPEDDANPHFPFAA